jgi:hypothetical protein
MTTWRNYPKRTDKLILVGMNARTRNDAPWDGPDEIWSLNEAYTEAWLKRWDRLFQIHKQSDWERRNNMADPNHALYLRGKPGACVFCAGTGKASKDNVEIVCPFCEGGTYTPPAHRAGKLVYMQEAYPDVPGAIALPYDEMAELSRQVVGAPYFTSTFALMLVFAAGWMHYSEIECYGFGMESDSEYANQRPCAEFWTGYCQARGVKVTAPGSAMFTGEQYAYGDSLMGLRTRLELRKNHLKDQLRIAEGEAMKAEGAVNAVAPFKDLPDVTPAYDLHFDDHWKKKNFTTGLRFTILEVDNALRALDAFKADGTEHPGDARAAIEWMYELG